MNIPDHIIILIEIILMAAALGIGIWLLQKRQRIAARKEALDAQNRIRELDRQLDNPQQRYARSNQSRRQQPSKETKTPHR